MNTIKTICDKNNIDKSVLEKAKEIMLGGGLVAFPTETVYGLGGNALDANSSKKIYEAKGRPSDNPLIAHISSMEELSPLTADIPDNAKKLMEEFWPGPMTLVFNKSEIVPYETTGGLDTVAIRMPSHPVARELIRTCGFPIAAPSANTSGRPSPTKAEHVIEDLDGKVDMIIDSGSCDIGLESTIIDVTGDTPVILRPGYVSPQDVLRVCGEAHLDGGILEKEDEKFKPKAPGMKYRHYAPKAPMTIIKGKTKSVAEKIAQLMADEIGTGTKVGIICDEDTRALIDEITGKSYDASKVFCLTYGKMDDGNMAAKNLYDFLRRMNEEEVGQIFARAYEGDVMKTAITNRMLKAAGYNEIIV